MLEKLGGFVTISVAAAVLFLISVFDPPIFVQIICAFAGSVVCLVGIVVLFSEGQIWTKERRGKTAAKAG